MKRTIKTFRILTCVFTVIYTALAGFHVGETAAMKCMKIALVDGAYSLVFDRITGDAWFYIISGVVLLLLCVATVIFLFRKGWISAVIAVSTTLILSIYSVLLNTQISEVSLWREPMLKMGIYGEGATDMNLAIKPGLARLCIIFAVCYLILSVIAHKKSQKISGDKNEQNS